MTELDALEEWMAELLRSRRALAKVPEAVEGARRHIRGNGRLSPVDRLDIYREQFWLRHTAALVEDFPGLGGVIGQESWERLVEGYLTEHAPDSWTLRDLGKHLPEYVERAVELPHHAVCVDMARLEWAYIELFDAPDVAPIDAEKLARIPEDAWERAVLVLHPAFRLLEVSYPVADLRRALREPSGEPVPIPERAPRWLALYRGADRALYDKSLPRVAFRLLSALHEGAALGPACERAAADPSEAIDLQAQIAGWFGQWGRLGWIVDVVV